MSQTPASPDTRGAGVLATLVACVVSLALVSPSRARAEPEPWVNECVERLDDHQVDELLAFTERSASEQRLGASLWYSGWTAYNLANVSVGAWKIATAGRLERDAWIMTTIGAGAFVLGASALPLPGLYAHRRLRRQAADTPELRRKKLKLGLELLEHSAKEEDRKSNLTAHLGALLFGVLSAGYIYFHNLHGDRHAVLVTMSLQFVGTVLGAQATLWSVPRRARRDLAHVREDPCAAGPPRTQLQAPTRALTLTAGPGYIGLRLRF